MHHRIRDILLVSSLYDLTVFEEDGQLYEQIRDKYHGMNLTHAPELTRVSNGEEAIALLHSGQRFDLILTTLHIEDMRPADFAAAVRESGFKIPIAMLAFDNLELSEMILHQEDALFDGTFIWQGDFRLILAIIKYFEDRLNLEHDTNLVGVQSILLIEDNILYYSSLLPMLYVEIMNQAQRLIEEGVNLSHRRLRMRARPKIILCTNYEEAWSFFEAYSETVLGVISDIDFPKEGKLCKGAGLDFARAVKRRFTDIPILLQSKNPAHAKEAVQLGGSFLLKDLPTMLQQLHEFMLDQLSFGDFIFHSPDGREVGKASDLISLEKELESIPEDCLIYHASRNHFSNWLKARTEFWLAHELRPRKLSDFSSIEDMRQDLIHTLREYRQIRQRGFITDFEQDLFDPKCSLSRIGSGSLGGKARGLSFINTLINNANFQKQFKNIHITIPSAVILGTDIFDHFLNENNLRDFALNTMDDEKILNRFSKAKKFPDEVMADLAGFLDLVNTPLAIRSSSLLEDSHVYPFAGVYRTFMLPNAHPDPFVRLLELVKTIKKVYASTFLKSAKKYMKATAYRLEEEKMAVVIQKMVGFTHENRFYPTFSGVAKSHNFYPMHPQTYADGIVQAALGLGKTVVEGGASVRFCPKYPRHFNQFATAKEAIASAQRSFYALDLKTPDETKPSEDDHSLKSFDLDVAERDGELSWLASTYLPENDRITDGTSREGLRLITFAPLLKHAEFPIHEILVQLLEISSRGMGTPVEIEFAVNLSPNSNEPSEFAVLQVRPVVMNRVLESMQIEQIERDQLICQSTQVLGNKIIENIHHIVLVDRDRFDRSKSKETAIEISELNARLIEEECPYLLVGVGRWGSLDPWLGIPVTWEQIAGAQVIIEAGFKDMSVEPSQGSHFFQNLNSFQIGYLTIKSTDTENFVDWDWLLQQEPLVQNTYTKLLRFENPITIKMSAHQNRGIVMKPNISPSRNA
ncbi:histidine kinase [candidate division KSB1 bacterium]|nr:histidine kinase [candidate division KSB1 bacterium]